MSALAQAPSVKAKVVYRNQSACLVASFEESSPPMVWQFDLDKHAHFSLHVMEKDGVWDLGYTLPLEGFVLVAHFDEREEAERAYEKISKELMRSGQGPMASSSGSSFLRRAFFWILVLALAYLLVSLALSGINASLKQKHLARAGLTGVQTVLGPEDQILEGQPTIKNGVPMSADDVLPKD